MTKKKEFNPEIKPVEVAQPQGAWASPFSKKLEEIQEVEESQSVYSTISSKHYFNSSGNVVVAPGGAFPNIVEHHTTNGVSENATTPSFAAAAAASSQQPTAGMAFESKRVLIVDAGALLHGQTRLEQLGSEFYTTPQVIQEIRDSKSRHILASLPVQLNVKEPQPDSFSKVIRFAKKTGDFGFLSTSDLGILALTYEMELAANGAKNIKPEPKALGISGNPKVPITPYYEVMAILKGRPLRKEEEEELEQDEQQEAEEEQWEENVITSLDSDEEKHAESKEQKQENEEAEEEEEQEIQESSSDEDDGEGWISPENIKTMKAQKSANVERWVKPEEPKETETAPAPAVVEATSAPASAPAATESTTSPAPATESNTSAPSTSQNANVIQRVIPNQSDSKVGCVTGDFAMQNVLLHMGLNLVSIDGRVMRVLKRWVKRCEECATLVVDTKRIFCPSCGNGDTLRKISCITDSNGNTYYCFNPKKKFSLRGTKFAIPKQQGGRNAKNPILREDQLAKYKEYVPSVASKTKSLLNRKRNVGEDNWTISYSFDNNFSKSEKRQAYKQANSAFNGIGRRNPNEPKKRTSKKKK